MKRMHLIILAFVIVLALCGWLTLRHAIRTAVIVPRSDCSPLCSGSMSGVSDGSAELEKEIKALNLPPQYLATPAGNVKEFRLPVHC